MGIYLVPIKKRAQACDQFYTHVTQNSRTHPISLELTLSVFHSFVMSQAPWCGTHLFSFPVSKLVCLVTWVKCDVGRAGGHVVLRHACHV